MEAPVQRLLLGGACMDAPYNYGIDAAIQHKNMPFKNTNSITPTKLTVAYVSRARRALGRKCVQMGGPVVQDMRMQMGATCNQCQITQKHILKSRDLFYQRDHKKCIIKKNQHD